MARWTSVETHPTFSGMYRVRCGNSLETFWAVWKKKSKTWHNEKGEEIVFGRIECKDAWRESKRTRNHG